VPKRTRIPSFFELWFEHPKKALKRAPGYPRDFKAEALGPLKSPGKSWNQVGAGEMQVQMQVPV